MRARAAYISSLGTGGIIVASALLMLAMVSALVAFRGWPAGTTSSGPVSSVPLTPSAPVATLRESSAATGVTATSTATRARRGGAAGTSLTTAGLRKEPVTVIGNRAVGVFKTPPTTVAPTPPVQFPPPSTGPQRHDSPQPPAHKQPPGEQPGPLDPVIDTLPDVPVPGDVNGTTSGVMESLPPLPGGQTRPPDDAPLGLGGTGVAAVDDVTR